MDVSQYLEIFLDETNEHLQNLNTQILSLEQDPENMDTINEIFRAAHSLKGMAGTMGYKRMQTLTHDMENVFSEVRNGAIKVNADMIDVLFQCLDALEEYNTNIRESSDEGTNDNGALIKRLNSIMSGGSSEDAENDSPASEAPKESTETVSADGFQKFREIKLNENQQSVLKEADKQGKMVYGLTVKVQESCILKAARAFLVFKAIEETSEIIVSDPSSQDIEDEKFDLYFSLIIISEEELDKIVSAAKSVSEIEDVTGGVLNMNDVNSAKEQDEEEAEEVQVQHQTAPQTPESPAQQQTAPQAPTPQASAPAETVVVQPTVQDQAPAPAPAPAAKKTTANKPVVNRTVRVDIEKLDTLMNLVSELIIAKNSLVSASAMSGNSSQAVNEQIEYLESVTTSLHESVMKVRMVPIESTVNKFPRMVRDLQKKLGKKMELYMSGEETELDRTVIDEIGDPLMHLLRNSADHGLESNEERIRLGKPEVGSIFLDAYQDGNNVVIEVRDDGAGIDVDKVRKKAIDKGTITEKQAETMKDKDFIDLLFQPSFSTADQITDVSGRGVGLDVVKTKIEALGGNISAKTIAGEGSTFTIQLPLTLAIIQALMVEVGEEKYAIPLGSINGIEDIGKDEISFVQSKEVINLRGHVIPILRLQQLLDIPEPEVEPENLLVVIMQKGDQQVGLIIDNLIGQQETVIKSLGRYITNDKLFSGATILGDGEVALILDTNTLI